MALKTGKERFKILHVPTGLYYSPTKFIKEKKASRRAGGVGDSPPSNPAEIREQRIREAAYFRAERRGFTAGHDLDDWLEAQDEVDRTTRPISAR